MRTFSSTMRTLSGCCRALSSQFALPNSISMRSVPADTSVAEVWISSWPEAARRLGTSASWVLPSLRLCKTCFMPKIFYLKST